MAKGLKPSFKFQGYKILGHELALIEVAASRYWETVVPVSGKKDDSNGISGSFRWCCQSGGNKFTVLFLVNNQRVMRFKI